MQSTQTDFRPIDRAATFLLGSGFSASDVWQELCRRYPDIHSNILAERIAAAMIAGGF
jgi:hypothetical protein